MFLYKERVDLLTSELLGEIVQISIIFKPKDNETIQVYLYFEINQWTRPIPGLAMVEPNNDKNGINFDLKQAYGQDISFQLEDVVCDTNIAI